MGVVCSVAFCGKLVSSEVTITPGASYYDDRDRFEGVLTVLITGGSGSGWFTPQFTLVAPTDESSYGALRAYANIAIGSAVWRAPTLGDSPQYSCTVLSEECSLPFTFGVPVVLPIEAWTSVWVDASMAGFSGYVVSASVSFDGIEAPRSSPSIGGSTVYSNAQVFYDVSSVPEPATMCTTALGILAAAVLACRSRRHSRF